MNARDWIKLDRFRQADLDGKSVEFQTEGNGTGFGTLRVRQNAAGLLSIQIVSLVRGGAQQPPSPLPELLSFQTLLAHPKPQRAHFLLAKDPDRLVALMD